MYDAMTWKYIGSDTHYGGVHSYDPQMIRIDFVGSYWPNCEPLKLKFPDAQYGASYGTHYRI